MTSGWNAGTLTALAAQEHDPEIVNAMRTVAARCAQAAEAITARHLGECTGCA
jgi:hypothetical protein